MAKGLRASTSRTNRRKLRATVFGPAEKARAERLHAKLLATIQAEKPVVLDKEKGEKKTKKSGDVDVEEEEEESVDDDAMALDTTTTTTTTTSTPNTTTNTNTNTSTKKPHRTQQHPKTKNSRPRKPKNSISFPSARGKGALKPFSSRARVGKRG